MRDRQAAGPAYHRFALNSAASVSAPFEKSFSRVSSPILASSAVMSSGGDSGCPPASNTILASSSSFVFSRNLVWVNIKLLRQFRDRRVALNRRQR